MIERTISKAILTEGVKYPIITIVGPRQSGKTTLARHLFPSHTYVNLEQPDIRLFAEKDPIGFFTTFKPPVILDEIQTVPSLLSQIQVLSDMEEKDAQFILTGSHQTSLSAAISQSLAGRTAIFTLLPLSLEELQNTGITNNRDRDILYGGMPRVYAKDLNPESYYRDYITTYLERDVRTMVNVKNLSRFTLFLTLLAGRTGQLVNLSSLASDVGVSSATLSEWLSVLEASYIIFRVTPWYGNIGKRLTKTAKIFFVDTGIPCSLLSITDQDRLNKDSLRGNLFENLVIAEAFKTRYNANKKPSLHFLRTESGLEIDLIDQKGSRLIPYEIKSADSVVDEYFNSIRKCSSFMPALDRDSGGLIYSGPSLSSSEDRKAWNYRETGKLFS